jgi:hypothetical protein
MWRRGQGFSLRAATRRSGFNRKAVHACPRERLFVFVFRELGNGRQRFRLSALATAIDDVNYDAVRKY